MVDIGAALDHLRSLPEVSDAGLWRGGLLPGWQAGLPGGLSTAPGGCAVGYYGVGIEKALGELEGLRGRMVLHFAEADTILSPEPAREAILGGLAERAGYRGLRLPGVDHAFARPAGHHYDKPAALLAHERTIAALRRTLARLQPVGAVGRAHPPRIRYPRRAGNHGHHGARALRQTISRPMTGGVGYRELARFYSLSLRAWQSQGT